MIAIEDYSWVPMVLWYLILPWQTNDINVWLVKKILHLSLLIIRSLQDHISYLEWSYKYFTAMSFHGMLLYFVRPDRWYSLI